MPAPTLSPDNLPNLPQWPGVRVFCSTRLGGVSKPPLDTLNLGLHVGDAAVDVDENRQRLAKAWGVKPVFLNQVHGTALVRLDEYSPDMPEADACWTQQPGVACTIMVADCLPVLFYQAQARVVAAAHAGWRGLAAGVLELTLHALSDFGAPGTWRVWLGPCIGPQAFEVGKDVRAAFEHQALAAGAFKALAQPGKYLADLAALARQGLQQAGVVHLEGNDSSPDWCTFNQAHLYFSHRRDGRSGRFAAGITLA